MRYFLAFSYNVHDSSVSIADEERALCVLEAERYFGEKKKRCTQAEMETPSSPWPSISAGIRIEDVERRRTAPAYQNEHAPFGSAQHPRMAGRDRASSSAGARSTRSS